MSFKVPWQSLKTLITAKGIYPQFVEDDENIYVLYSDSGFQIQSIIPKISEDADEFDATYRALSNQPIRGPQLVNTTFVPRFQASDSVVSCTTGVETDVDYKVTEDFNIYGGEIIVEDARIGDYFRVYVYDVDSIIPEADRATQAVDWPIVAEIVEKRYIRPEATSSIISVDIREILSPIAANLYIRVAYFATAVASTRKMVINYFLAK